MTQAAWRGIPGALFHGHHDLGSPVDTARHLTAGWPEADLAVIADAGHKGSATMSARVRAALDTYALMP